MLCAKVKDAFRRAFSLRPLGTGAWYSSGNVTNRGSDANVNAGMDLGKIERGTITGLRTFMDEYQRTPGTASDIMSSQIREESDDLEEACPLSDQTAIGGIPGSRRQDKFRDLDGSGRHDKTIAHRDSRRHDKILAHKESRKYDKMLNSQESRKRDKMLIRQKNDEHDKVLAIENGDEHNTTLSIPAKVRRTPIRHDEESVLLTGDSTFDGSGRWLRRSANRKQAPKTRVGMISKMTCGPFIFSAGLKAEKYTDRQ